MPVELFGVLFLPLLAPFVARAWFGRSLDPLELALNLLLGVAVTAGVYFAGLHSMTSDSEILNGAITGKSKETVSCSHSYSCNCRTSRSANGASSTSCDTCYEHNHDYDWSVKSTVGNFLIDRVNRQGSTEPARFTRAQIGDPVAREHTFTNYVLAVPESLFNYAQSRTLLNQYAGKLPEYPGDIYDYHYAHRALTVNAAVPNLSDWDLGIANILRTAGPLKQVNVVIVFTKESDANYANALQAHWLGGKKNDVVVVAGVDAAMTPQWVRVLSWTDRENFRVELRDAIQSLPSLTPDTVLPLLESHIQRSFVRKPMADFAYLKNEISPPAWVLALAIVLGLSISIGSSFYFAKRTTFLR